MGPAREPLRIRVKQNDPERHRRKPEREPIQFLASAGYDADRRAADEDRVVVLHQWEDGCILGMYFDSEMPEFTAICPFSDFPDFAIIRLKYMPNRRCIELKSLKLYINSFRNVKIFHEHVINLILEDFVAACDPLRVEIEGDFHVRGNIKTIIRASYTKK